MKTHRLFCAAVALYAAVSCGGTLTVKFGSAMEVEIDGAVQSFAANATFTPAAIPCIYKMRPALGDGERTFGIKGSEDIRGGDLLWRFPQYGDGNWVRVALNPYPSSDTTVTLTGYKTSNFYYVDAENGNDDWDGTADYEHRDEPNSKGPKKSLQAANDAATGSYPIVFAAPGVYNTGVATNYSSGTSNPCVRRLISTKNNIGFIATEGAEKTFIVGAPDTSGTDGKYGADSIAGVYMQATSSSASQFLQGFTITGCYSPAAQSGANQYGMGFCSGAHRSYCLDCVISNNYAVTSGSATYYGVVERSRIMENESYQFTTRNGVFAACIFAGNRITMGDSTAANRALHYKGNTYFCTYDLRNANQASGRKRVEDADSSLRTALVYGLTDKSTIDDARWFDSQAIDAPLFANADARDYRLSVKSSARSVSSYEGDLDGVARRLMASDVDGRMPVLHDGKLSLGAVWNEPQVWYVAQNGGNDANDGISAETAKATINAAIALSFSGDTIRVAPGTYGEAEGAQFRSATSKSAFRIVVPEDVTIESTGGATSTFIVGAQAIGDDRDNEEYGTGTNSVRCVYAGDGATVRGFTLTGGRGVGAGTAGGAVGAAFCSATALGATVEDCVISNNAAYYYTIYQAVVKRCRVFDNAATMNAGKSGSAGWACGWYGTVIDKNKGDSTVYNAVVIENCTIGDDNRKFDGTTNPQVLDMRSGTVVMNNTVILGGRLYGASSVYSTNCLIKSSASYWPIPDGQKYNTEIGTSVKASLDGSYRPIFGSFAGIDRSGAIYSEALGDKDAYGNPRVMNGAIDVGAVEYDWRPRFAQAVSKKLTLTDVSPSVTTNAAGGLLITSGAVVGTVAEGGKYVFTFTLSGGSLEAFIGGESAGVYSSAGEQSVVMEIPDAATEFRLVFTPDGEAPGSAVLTGIASNRGFVISFR